MASPQRYCRSIVRRSGSTFALAFRLLNRRQRRGMYAVYAFCRVVDDIVDNEESSIEVKFRELNQWCDELERIEKQHALEHPLTIELAWAIQEFNIDPKYMMELISGCAVDIEPRPFETIEDTLGYCYGVASTVGLMCLPIFGVFDNVKTIQAATDLGYAFQLTNMIRDLHEDAVNGRFYLPQSDLKRHLLVFEDFVNVPDDPEAVQRMRDFILYQITRVRRYYAKAWTGFSGEQQKAMAPAQLMSDCYERILGRIEANPFSVFQGKVSLTKWEKVRLIAKRIAA